MLAYCGPPKAATASDVKRLLCSTKDTAKLDSAEGIIIQAQELLAAARVSAEIADYHVAMLQRDAAAVLLNKTSSQVRRFETIDAAAEDMLAQVNMAAGVNISSPWAAQPSNKKAAPSVAKPCQSGPHSSEMVQPHVCIAMQLHYNAAI